MGTWGYGPFENDDAADAVIDLAGGTFDFDTAVELNDEYLEAPDAAIVIALAEVVAAGRGLVSHRELAEVDTAAFAAELTEEQHARILETLERAIVGAETSELYDLWAENGPEDVERWSAPIRARIDSLRISA